MSPQINRRSFLNKSAAATAAATVLPSTVFGKEGATAPGEKIRVGIIGVNGMGIANLNNVAKHPDTIITGICDVSKARRDAQLKRFPEAKGYGDFRKMLTDDSCDAVIIATPPHWHCIMAVEAAKAGKDIYLQKPMTLHLGESLAVKNAVKKHKIICQVGTQIHAGQNYRRVVEKVQAGCIGEVSVAKAFNVMNQGPKGIGKGNYKDTPPEGVDWEMWCGPGPESKFNSTLFANSYNHCSWFEYTGGWTPGMAPHLVDLPVWALDLGYPTQVQCTGGRYIIDDDGDAPDTQEMLFAYPKKTLHWTMSCINSFAYDLGRGKPARRSGIYFFGDKATLFTNYSKHEIVPEGKFFDASIEPTEEIPSCPGHEAEWVNCIKSRKQPSCNPDYHCKVDIPLVLGNLSMVLGRSIQFDPEKLAIVGDEEAAKKAIPEYRAPWKFPAEYL